MNFDVKKKYEFTVGDRNFIIDTNAFEVLNKVTKIKDVDQTNPSVYVKTLLTLEFGEEATQFLADNLDGVSLHKILELITEAYGVTTNPTDTEKK